MLKHIYDKTDKGREEIATRKYHVPAKLRALLLMIDGRRPLDVLMKNFGPLGLSQENIIDLLAADYIAMVDDGEPEPALEVTPAHKPAAVSARARMVARRTASAHAHHEHHEHDGELGEAGASEAHRSPAQAAAAGVSQAEHFLAVREFYMQTIKSTLGLRGMMLQMKVEKCAGMEDLRELREVYLDAVLKAKGREMALSLSGRLDQLLASEQASHA